MNYYEFNCTGADSWTMTEKCFIKIKDKDLIPPHMIRNVDIYMPEDGDDIGHISIRDMYDRKKAVFFSYEERGKAEEVFKKLLDNEWIEKYDSDGWEQSEREAVFSEADEIKAQMREVSESIEEARRDAAEGNGLLKKGKDSKSKASDLSKKDPLHDKNRMMMSSLSKTAEDLERAGDRTCSIIVILTVIELIGALISGIITAVSFENFWLFLVIVGSGAVWSAAWFGAAVGIKASFYRQALMYRAHEANLRCSDEILKKLEKE